MTKQPFIALYLNLAAAVEVCVFPRSSRDLVFLLQSTLYSVCPQTSHIVPGQRRESAAC